MKNVLLFILAFGFVFASGCKKDEKEQAEKDEEIIQKYIADHNLNATATGSGLYVVVTNQGSGSSCNQNSDVRVAYKGYLPNGTGFDESSVSGVEFNLQQVIKGWTEGIPYFKEGGNGILLIPSALGYGSKSQGSIPANSVLIFEVNLIDVL